MSNPEIPGFRIVRALSEGTRARIYLAEQTSLQRLVALKILSGEVSDHDASRVRVIEDGKLAARMTHPNLLSVFDIGVHDGQYYIATEHVSGGTLRDRLTSEAVQGAQTLAPNAALGIARDLATGLAFLHQHGFLHRDIKPTNVLFRDDGTALLSEAGVSRAASAKTPENEHVAFGSPHYMSPERAQAQPSDASSDIYSLGVVLWEALTGRPPFDADDPFQVAIKHINDPLPALPDHLKSVASLLQTCLAKDPAQRFAGADQLVKAIDQILADRGVAPKTNSQAAVPAAAPVRPAEALAKVPAPSQSPSAPPSKPALLTPETVALNPQQLAATAQMQLPNVPPDIPSGEMTERVDPIGSSSPPPVPAPTMLGQRLPVETMVAPRAPVAPQPPSPAGVQYTQPVQPFTPPPVNRASPMPAPSATVAQVPPAQGKSKLGMVLLMLGLLGLLAAGGAYWWIKRGAPGASSGVTAPTPEVPKAVEPTVTTAAQTPSTETSADSTNSLGTVDRLLERAQQAELAGNLVVPEKDCAAFYYRQVIGEDASNSYAILGLESVQAAVEAEINKFVTEGQMSSAKGLADAAVLQFPDNDRLVALQQKLAQPIP